MTDTTEKEPARRSFLKLAMAAPAVAAATVAGTAQADAATATGPQQGLADTAHTRAYFASARF